MITIVILGRKKIALVAKKIHSYLEGRWTEIELR